MADYVIRSSREINGCDGCPCQNYNPIMRVPFCNLALETLTEEYAKQKPKWCPLVEVPTHGRLVEADSVKKIIRNDVSSDCDECVGYTCGLIDEMPTIIEASQEKG